MLAFLTLLIRTMRRPLDDLAGAARRMSSGDLSARVEAGGPKELEAVGLAFNAMGADLANASARLETQRQRLATTIQSLGDGLVMCDNNDRITSLNPRANELVATLRVGAVAHGPHSPLPELNEALAREVLVRSEGDIALAVTAARLAGPDGGVVWTLRDITERARLEQAKSDFVATASHELRSPLTSIKGFIELLETTNAENLTERQREFIRIALESTDRLVELVNDLLDIARIESGQFEIHPRSVDLRETLTEVAALIEPRLQSKRQRLDVQIFDPRPAALADPARIRQVVTNLVTNAHLYTPENGSITLRLEGDAQKTTITVSDTGQGISPEEARRLFDRFFRGSTDERRSPGTGLGLSIVKSLVDLHGGTIDVQSTPGRGTTFTVRLPSAAGNGGIACASSGVDAMVIASSWVAATERSDEMVSAEQQLQERVTELAAELAERTREAAAKERQLERYAADLRETFKEERARAQELRRSYTLTVRALASAVEARDAYTGRHAERVAAYGLRLAMSYGMRLGEHPEMEFGFLLHDVGKVAVPDAILFKPGPLTSAERLIMQQHPITGWEIVRDIDFLGAARDVIRHHHERWDGDGYPDGLASDAIPVSARDLRARRHARRADDRAPVPAGVDVRRRPRADRAGRRHAFRSDRRRRVRVPRRRRAREHPAGDRMTVAARAGDH